MRVRVTYRAYFFTWGCKVAEREKSKKKRRGKKTELEKGGKAENTCREK